MIITADDRRQILGLYNISEAARFIGVDVGLMHREVRKGNLPAPEFCIGKRCYYTDHDLKKLMMKMRRCDERASN